LDAVSLRVRTVDRVTRCLILAAYGIRTTGQRELIDSRVVRVVTAWRTPALADAICDRI